MSFPVLGTGPTTKYQLSKFASLHQVTDEMLIDLYLQYAMKYNIWVDFAYVQAMIFTDFLEVPIIGNNPAGLGPQLTGTKLEVFNSLEEGVAAHCQLIRKCADANWSSMDSPISNLIRRVSFGQFLTREAIYEMMGYEKSTEYAYSDLNRYCTYIQTIQRDTSAGDLVNYYYIRVRSSTSKADMIKLRSDLKDRGFYSSQMFLSSHDGVYTLELGRCKTPGEIGILQSNLRLFGFDGEIEYRRT